MEMRMTFDNYVFDLYGTLVDIKTDEEQDILWEKLALFYGYYDALYRPEELKAALHRLIAQGEKNLLRHEEYRKADTHEAFPEVQIEQIFLQLFQEKGVAADLELAVHAGQFFRILSTEYVRLYEGVPELLSTIQAAGKKIYLLSNAQRIFTEYEMHTLGIAYFFDDILISSEYGVKKPDCRFFEVLLNKYGMNPARSVMIGNDAKSDIAGAKQVGMSTFYIHSNISPELTEEVDADMVLLHMDMQQVKKMLEEA
jgi:putative hydrolase of the HAD superfamily